MTLVDVYDAVRSKRVYKEPIPHKEAVEIIKEGRGTIFDPEIVDVFMGIEDQFEKTYEKYSTKAPEQESWWEFRSDAQLLGKPYLSWGKDGFLYVS